jgi:polar amino acid transport system permease protein
MTWNWSYAWDCLPNLLRGLLVTLEVTAGASAIALIVGLVYAALILSPVRIVSLAVRFVVDFFRGTPLVVQVFFWYYALPEIGIRAGTFAIGVVGLGLYGAAYTADVYRAGIQNLPKSQWEAGAALSLPHHYLWADIIIPQSFRAVLPALGNYVILMLKYTPILTTITVSEMLAQGLDLGSKTYSYLEPLTIVGILFIVVTLPCVFGLRKLEQRLSRATA